MTDAEKVRMLAEKDRDGLVFVARCLGWPIFDRETPDGEKPGCDSGPLPCIVENTFGVWFALVERGHWSTFRPFESMDSVYAVEAALPPEKRDSYVRCLCDAADQAQDGRKETALWNVAHATPRQRMDAVIAVLRGEAE